MTTIFTGIETVNLSSGSTGASPDVIYTFSYDCLCHVTLQSDDRDNGDTCILYIVRPNAGANRGPNIVFRYYDFTPNAEPLPSDFDNHYVGASAIVRSGEELLLDTDQTSFEARLTLFRIPDEQA